MTKDGTTTTLGQDSGNGGDSSGGLSVGAIQDSGGVTPPDNGGGSSGGLGVGAIVGIAVGVLAALGLVVAGFVMRYAWRPMLLGGVYRDIKRLLFSRAVLKRTMLVSPLQTEAKVASRLGERVANVGPFAQTTATYPRSTHLLVTGYRQRLSLGYVHTCNDFSNRG